MKQSSENVAKNEVTIIRMFSKIYFLWKIHSLAPNLFFMLYDVKASGSKILKADDSTSGKRNSGIRDI